eukprot:IDg15843t1
MVHACRVLEDKLGYSSDYALLQLEFSNAFNLVSQYMFLRVVRTYCFKMHVVSATNAELQRTRGCRSSKQVGTARWSPEEKSAKPHAFAAAHEAYPPQVVQYYGGITQVLQAPIGHDAFIEQEVLIQVNGMQPLLDTVAEIGAMHVAFILLRACFAACSLSHRLLCVPSTLVMHNAIAEAFATTVFLVSASLCAGMLRIISPRDTENTLDRYKLAPAAHLDLSERCASGAAPPLNMFGEDVTTHCDTERLVHDAPIAFLPDNDDR